MFDLILARLAGSLHATATRPPRDRHATVGNSLLDASATMAKVKVELHPAVAVAIGLVAFPSIVLCVVGCVVGWKRWKVETVETGYATGASARLWVHV